MNSRTCLYQDFRLFFDSQTSAAVQLRSLKWNVTSNKRFHVCFCLRLNKTLFTDTSGLVCSAHVGMFYSCCEAAKSRWRNQSGVWQLIPKEGIQDRKCQRKPELPETKWEKDGRDIAQHHSPLFWDPSGSVDLVSPGKQNSRSPCLWVWPSWFTLRAKSLSHWRSVQFQINRSPDDPFGVSGGPF